MVEIWRDVTLGNRNAISQENERHWRSTLEHLCDEVIQDAKRGLLKVRDIQLADQENRAKEFIDMLWREEMDVGCAVLKSLEDGADF